MSEFSHIEITIETVAADGTRTRTTRWTCPSVEMGSTRDQRVQLRFAGEPVVVAGEPTKPGTGAFWTPLDTALAIDAAARHRAAEAEIDDLAHRPGLTLDDLPRLRREAAETPPLHTGGRVPKGTIIYRHATFPHRPRSADGRRTCPAAPPDPCATESPRDVATDPRVGDRVTVGGWLRTVEAVEPGRILVYSGPRFYWRPEEWAFLCQMPGAVIERAEDRPPRDVARSPKVGDRITINEAGERTTYEVQGFPEEGIACWASADGRPIGPCVVSPARWKAACGEGSGAVIERAPE